MARTATKRSIRLDEQLTRLATLSPAGLRDAWEHAYGSACPRLSPALLQLGLAYRVQVKTHGGLPAAAVRELDRIFKGEDAAPARLPTPTLRPGTQLVREWQGRVVRVEVLEDGYLWEGVHHTSLSSIAKAVTGAHWSGPRFFGMAPRG